MATYTFTVIESNLLGDTGVTIKEESAQDGMALLLNSLGNTNYEITSLCLWTDNPKQLDNIVFVDDIDANGNITSIPFIPYIDSNALQNRACIDLTGFKLNVNTKINYQIEGNTNIKMTFNLATNKELSTPKLIQEITGVDEIKDLRSKLGQVEPDESSGWDKVKPSEGKEPEEKGGGEAKPANDNVLSMQENLEKPMEQVWNALKKEDILALKADETYLNKQKVLQSGDVVTKKTDQEVAKIVKTIPKYNYDSEIVTLVVLGAIGLWIVSGRPNIIKNLT